MKIQLTKQAELELNRLNNLYGDENSPEYDNWDKMSEQEILITDAGLYVNNAYVNNSFKRLDNWCKRTGEGEFQDDHRMRVKKNIGKMLIEDIITIVE